MSLKNRILISLLVFTGFYSNNIFSQTICDCQGTVHTDGVLVWIGDGYPDDGGYLWNGQPVDFNCETWGYDCGDIFGAPNLDPYNVCGGNLPPNNGCSGGACLPVGMTAFDNGCQDDGLGNLLPVIGFTFFIDGACNVEDVCLSVDGGAFECTNLPYFGLFIFDGETVNLVNTVPDATYEIYFTTADGISSTIFYVNGNCDTQVPGCTDPLATNYNPNATVDDGSCVYNFTICDCVGTEHTAGVLSWVGDGYPDDGGYLWEGQPVDFNCETWGYDCGDILGAPNLDPYNVCGGDLPPNNGCVGGQCLPFGLTAFDAGCQDDGFGNLLPVIGFTFAINGTCNVEDLCWSVDGGAFTCANLPYNGFLIYDGEGINLINTVPDATYEVYFTTSDGVSSTIFYVNGNCDTDIPGCTDPIATNYNPNATIDDGSCIYNFTICDCAGTEHTAGVLTWVGDGYPDDGGYLWEGQPVDFNCETWGYDCGDILGAPNLDPFNVCGGDIPPNNGCAGGLCLPTGLIAFDAGCQDDGFGNLLPVIGFTFEIDGLCNVEDLCWSVDGGAFTCANLPANGFLEYDGGGINLINTTPDATYEVYFTTIDGVSSTVFYVNGNCDDAILGCTDPLASNYNPNATVNDGSCLYDFTICDCAGTEHTAGVLSWIGDGYPDDGGYLWEGQPVDFNCETWGYDCGDIVGAPNLDPNNVCGGDLPPNNGCEPDDILGCTNPNACNYNPSATLDDGTCEFLSCAGCTNPNACNYDPIATLEDGSCEFLSCVGCTDPNACNYNALATIDDGSCEFESCLGCTDSAALNYDPNALIDDGSCIYSCVYPVITYTPFCEDGEEDVFYVEMQITNLGNGVPYEISNNVNSDLIDLNFVGTITLGPFDSGLQVVISASSTFLDGCVITSPLLEMDCTVGLNELGKLGVAIYPNPFREIFNIDLGTYQKVHITIVNSQGQIVFEDLSVKDQLQIDASLFALGIYHVLIEGENDRGTTTLIKH